MGDQLSMHEEPDVGGPLDEARLRQILSRALRLRNWAAAPDGDDVSKLLLGERLTRGDDSLEGETPNLVHCMGNGDDVAASIELHLGCGESCPVLAEIPFDGDSGGVDEAAALAIAHAGRDMIDLAVEVASLRRKLEVSDQAIGLLLHGDESDEAAWLASVHEGERADLERRASSPEAKARFLASVRRDPKAEAEAEAVHSYAAARNPKDWSGKPPETLADAEDAIRRAMRSLSPDEGSPTAPAPEAETPSRADFPPELADAVRDLEESRLALVEAQLREQDADDATHDAWLEVLAFRSNGLPCPDDAGLRYTRAHFDRRQHEHLVHAAEKKYDACGVLLTAAVLSHRGALSWSLPEEKDRG